MADLHFVDVLFNLNVDRTFQYICPAPLALKALPGTRVLAPLRGRLKAGLVVGTGREAKVGHLLPIQAVPDAEPVLDADLMALLGWVTDHYLAPPGLALRAAVPRPILQYGLSHGPMPRETRLVAHPLRPPAAPPVTSLPPRQRQALDILNASGPMPAALLAQRAGGDHKTLRSLEAKGLLRLELERTREGPASAPPAGPLPELSPAQAQVSGALGQAMIRSGFRRFILHAPPASGKMEVFIQALARDLPTGRQALILVPELSLSPPLIRRLEAVFPGRLAVNHGRLTEAQKRDLWLRCRSGDFSVVIGSRSAVFAPLPDPAVIFVDEEQEPSYKSEETPRYNARDTAVARARLTGIPVVLSSAAPSLETLFEREEADVTCLSLPPHPGLRGTVKTALVDLKAEKSREMTVLSGLLRFALRENLAQGGRSILFVNRRGFASAVFCGDCSYTPRCPRCAVPLSFQGAGGLLACHLCGHREGAFLSCPRCGGTKLRPGSPGTRGVEQEVRKLLPEARTAVMDRDALSRKGDLERLYGDFAAGSVDVLIGTQLLARGLHWPRVSLVGVIDASTPLHRPDFRSAERAYQLLAQVVGRAGLGIPRARVIIQTYHPEHYTIQSVIQEDPDLFYRQELALRREARFPPFCRLILLLIEEAELEAAEKRARALRQALDEALSRPSAGEPAGAVEVLGPHTAPLGLKRQRHRQHILLKGDSPEILRRLVRQALAALPAAGPGGRLVIDVDPVDFL